MQQSKPILAFQGKAHCSGENKEYWPAHEQTYFAGKCPFCKEACRLLREEWNYDSSEQQDRLAVCINCGWWSYEADQSNDLSGGCYYYSSRAVLQEFAVDDKDVPYRELGLYLSMHHEKLVQVDPAKFEELVASVYRDALGNTVEFCSYGRPDKGIDVVCGRADSGRLFGIQVKRYRSSIELGQIHQFLGALQLARLDSGVFVTTSRFQKGCYEAIEQSNELLGIEIRLVDGRRFLEFLGLMNQANDRLYCPEWKKSGYTVNYGDGVAIPLSEILKAPVWPG
jgi:HJR/Mrr/RecB family endonuclease